MDIPEGIFQSGMPAVRTNRLSKGFIRKEKDDCDFLMSKQREIPFYTRHLFAIRTRCETIALPKRKCEFIFRALLFINILQQCHHSYEYMTKTHYVQTSHTNLLSIRSRILNYVVSKLWCLIESTLLSNYTPYNNTFDN